MLITGRSSHAGIEPEKGINAIRVAARIISGVPDGRLDHETTANIGMIQGGTATNVVPKEVIINGEVRSHSMTALEEARQTIFRIACRIAQENGAGLDISDHEEYRTFRIDDDMHFLRYMEEVFRRCGIEPVRTTTGGGSDANIFNQKEIMTVNISNGMQKVHSTEEHISLEDLYKGCLIVLTAVHEFPSAKLH
jgi:tripeptide aminopeptidase